LEANSIRIEPVEVEFGDRLATIVDTVSDGGHDAIVEGPAQSSTSRRSIESSRTSS
jgi:hypothetical protein